MNNLILPNNAIVQKVVQNKIGDIIKPLVKEIFLKNVAVEDVTFGQNNINLTKVTVGQELALKRQESLYDKYSVYVFTTDGDSLGEINEFDNQLVANLMDAGKKIKAVVKHAFVSYDSNCLQLSLYLLDF